MELKFDRKAGTYDPARTPSRPLQEVNMANILVIGTAAAEVITDERGESHRRLGGVAATLAQELQRGGLQPLLHTAFANDHEGVATQQALKESGLRWEHSPMQRCRRSPFCGTILKNGEPDRSVGHFPALGHLDFDVPYLEILAEEHEWVVIDAKIQPEVMRKVASRARNLAVVATEPAFNPSLAKDVAELPKAFFACNEREAKRICGNVASVHRLRQCANADAVLLTFGRQGWKFQSAKYGEHSPTPPAPPDADFIGVEAAAAAGAIHAITTSEPLKESVNTYITKRMQFNSGFHTDVILPTSPTRNRVE